MRIREVGITVENLPAAADFYRRVLQMTVAEESDHATVSVGHSRLILTAGQPFEGIHHLAFGISPHDFDRTREWMTSRLPLIAAGGSDIINGPDGWDSRSVYFLGPEDILLEFIAREADAGVPASTGPGPQALSVSEVGIGVAAVGSTVGRLLDTFGLPTFPPQEEQFAPVGGHDGLLIVVDRDRQWFPLGTRPAARGPLTVRIEAPGRVRKLDLNSNVTVVSAPDGA